MIYFTSDTHYGHTNISGQNLSKWKSGYRNFSTVEEMNRSIVDSINSVVGPYDTLFHLGDWSLGGKNNIWEFRKQIKCKYIILIFGNHDESISRNDLLDNCHYNSDSQSLENIVDGKDKNSLIGLPPEKHSYVHSKDLFYLTEKYYEFRHNKTLFCLFHYPIGSWNGMGKGSINIHGHCHHNYKPIGKQIDVGWCKWRRPLSIDEIIDMMKNIPVSKVDHH